MGILESINYVQQCVKRTFAFGEFGSLRVDYSTDGNEEFATITFSIDAIEMNEIRLSSNQTSRRRDAEVAGFCAEIFAANERRLSAPEELNIAEGEE